MSGFSRVSEEDVKNHPEYMSDAGDMMWDLDIDKKSLLMWDMVPTHFSGN